jgi:hypothetical protein
LSIDTLKNTSHDKENDVYLCNSQLSVVDFDQLTKILYPKQQPASFDALLIEEIEKKVFCIEFKNQENSNIKNQQIQKKAVDSIETLTHFCASHKINLKSYRLIACVVYKPSNNSYSYRRFKENVIHFGLDCYQGGVFDAIVTNPPYSNKYRWLQR